MNSLAGEQQTHIEQEQQTSAVLTSVNAASNNTMKTLKIPVISYHWLQRYSDTSQGMIHFKFTLIDLIPLVAMFNLFHT